MGSDFLKNNLTILSPIKVYGFKADTIYDCIESYYNCIDERPLHLIKDDSAPNHKEDVKNKLDELNANYRFINDGEYTNMFDAVVTLIENVNTKYFTFIIDDVITTKSYDFFTPAIQAMEQNEDLIQVKFGGGQLSEGSSNRDLINRINDDELTLKINNVKYNRIKLEKGSVWVTSLDHSNIINDFPLSYYNCIMRTDVFKYIHKKIIENRGQFPDNTWSDYLAYINYTQGINDRVRTNNWPQEFRFLNEKLTGWVNMASYIYAINRHQVDYNSFCESHTLEYR